MRYNCPCSSQKSCDPMVVVSKPDGTPHSTNDFQKLSCRGVVVITTAQLHSTKPELRFCTGSNLAHGELKIYNDEDL